MNQDRFAKLDALLARYYELDRKEYDSLMNDLYYEDMDTYYDWLERNKKRAEDRKKEKFNG